MTNKMKTPLAERRFADHGRAETVREAGDRAGIVGLLTSHYKEVA